MDLICSLYSWWRGFGSSSLSTPPLGFQLWFYFHLCTWVVHWGLLLRLPWRTWVCLCGPHRASPGPAPEGQVWRWCRCLGHRGSGSTRYSGELVPKAAGNIVLQKGMATSIGQYTPAFLPGEPPSLTEKPGRPQSTGSQRVGHDRSNPRHTGTRYFLLVAALPQ